MSSRWTAAGWPFLPATTGSPCTRRPGGRCACQPCGSGPSSRRRGGRSFPLHALRTEHDRGVGTYADLGRLAQWTGQVGGALVGTLPLYPVYLEEPVDPSPYRPVTKLGLSELYIDPTGLPELEIAPVARRLLASDALRQEVEASRASRFVDHGPVMATLRSVLAPMAEALFTTSSDRRSELEARTAARVGRLRPIPVGVGRLGSQWTGWSAAEVAMAGRGTDDDGEHFHLYVQWVAEQQLAAVSTRGGAGLYLDIPIGVHPSGFDPWRQRRAFATGGGGAPDAFFSGGQNWGFPPLHPEGLRDEGYRYLIAQMRQAFRHADAVRVDHIMGLDRLYWLPDGSDDGDGAYVQYRHEEMRAVVALEASRAGTAVVGASALRSRSGGAVAGPTGCSTWMGPADSRHHHRRQSSPVISERSLASLGPDHLVHLSSAGAGWTSMIRNSRGGGPGNGRPGRTSAKANKLALQAALNLDGRGRGVDTGELLGACLRHMAAGPSLLMLVDLEDLWLETEPQNRPGTRAVPNWRLRAARTLETSKEKMPGQVGLLRAVDGLRKDLITVGPTAGPEA